MAVRQDGHSVPLLKRRFRAAAKALGPSNSQMHLSHKDAEQPRHPCGSEPMRRARAMINIICPDCMEGICGARANNNLNGVRRVL
eukprot:scaffold164328_cov32-Tisochrysis_lutea.AAC.4